MADSGSLLLLNGEIYNFRELGARYGLKQRAGLTDTEVLLVALEKNGVEAFSELIGEFSLAYYNSTQNSLLLARDRLGTHPLFFSRCMGGYVVGSSASALAYTSGQRSTDWNKVADFVCHGVSPSGNCFTGVERIPPGHFVTLRTDNSVRSLQALARRHEEETLSIGETLHNALASRVTHDTWLNRSGGLDSNLLWSLWPTSRAGHSFTVTAGKASPKLQDVSVVQATKSELLRGVEKLSRHAERPIGSLSSSAFFLIAEKARSDGLINQVSGEGADEIFWGYPHYLKESARHPGLDAQTKELELFAKFLSIKMIPKTEALQREERQGRLEKWQQFDKGIRLSEHLLFMNSDLPALINSCESRVPFVDFKTHRQYNREELKRCGLKADLRRAARLFGAASVRKRAINMHPATLGIKWLEKTLKDCDDGTTFRQIFPDCPIGGLVDRMNVLSSVLPREMMRPLLRTASRVALACSTFDIFLSCGYKDSDTQQFAFTPLHLSASAT